MLSGVYFLQDQCLFFNLMKISTYP